MIRDPARQIADAENVVADLTDADSTAAALKGVDIDIGHTILRPNLYLQALLAFADTIAEGWFAAPIGDAAVSAMDIRDIAAAAAAVIMEPESTGRTYTLTGPRAVTHQQIADALSAATERPIRFQSVPAEQFAAALAGVLPPWQVEGLVEDYATTRAARPRRWTTPSLT
jgi:uncharacterized protein YbjT (DUF2867 family)